MSFHGNLEHFPLVDIIQLLHSTRKTGILFLKSPKGESQLVFHDGYFVSANHLNNSVRIGQVLVDMKAISAEQLEQTLAQQKQAGPDRKPLIATLIEQGIIDRELAYKGLESLIEMTIVEVLTWSTGTFTLQVSKEYASDEYRYFPEKLHQEVLVNAQGILMDALRIYDEKMHDGTLSTLFFAEGESEDLPEETGNSAEITADLLGLGDLDSIERKIPDTPIKLNDYNPADEHRRIVIQTFPDADGEQQEQLISFLVSISDQTQTGPASPVTAIILLTSNEFLSHAITTACRHEGLFVISSDEDSALDAIIEQSLGRERHPVLLIDIPHGENGDQALSLLLLKKSVYPQITTIITACCQTVGAIGMQALRAGAYSVIPRPCLFSRQKSCPSEMKSFLSDLALYVSTITPPAPRWLEEQFPKYFSQMKMISEPPEAALAILNFTAVMFERAITFVVAKSELIAEKSIRVSDDKTDQPSQPLMFKIPLENRSIFQDVVKTGRLYYGQRDDSMLTSILYREIGAPRSARAILIPLVCRGKVIALTYADFGSKPVQSLKTELFEILAQYAGTLLDNALYRKSIEKTP